MTKFEEEFNYLIELSGKVLIGQVAAEAFEKNRIVFFEKYETDQQQSLPVVPEWLDIEIKNLKSTSKHPTVDVLFGVADAIVAVKNRNIHSKLYDYLFCGKQDVCNQHQAIFALAFITGKYEVEKQQLFRLKLKNAPISNYYLWLNQATGKVFVDKKFLDWTNHDNVKNIFTEQEIAKISDGAFVNNEAFELVPVEDRE